MKMHTQKLVANEFDAIIPAELRAKYSADSYAEMAEKPDCAEYRDELLRLDALWFSAIDA